MQLRGAAGTREKHPTRPTGLPSFSKSVTAVFGREVDNFGRYGSKFLLQRMGIAKAWKHAFASARWPGGGFVSRCGVRQIGWFRFSFLLTQRKKDSLKL